MATYILTLRLKALDFKGIYPNCTVTMYILGLKPTRLREWLAVVGIEGGHRVPLSLFGMLWRSLSYGVSRSTWRTRVRTCASCPIYNPHLRQCRPEKGSPFGCGCYVPYMAMTRGACWGWDNTENLGWE